MVQWNKWRGVLRSMLLKIDLSKMRGLPAAGRCNRATGLFCLVAPATFRIPFANADVTMSARHGTTRNCGTVVTGGARLASLMKKSLLSGGRAMGMQATPLPAACTSWYFVRAACAVAVCSGHSNWVPRAAHFGRFPGPKAQGHIESPMSG